MVLRNALHCHVYQHKIHEVHTYDLGMFTRLCRSLHPWEHLSNPELSWEPLDEGQKSDSVKFDAFQVTVAGNSPLGREGHAACILSRFLLISSGINTSSTGSQRRLADTHILDMATPSWECIDDGAWASSSTWRQMLAQYCVFHGNRLYMLKPSK